MSGKAVFAVSQNLYSCGRMSMPTAAGFTRSVAWLMKLSPKYS